MKNYKMYATSINERYLDEIVEILKKGGIIIYPTDSLYAIGCDALNNRAVERVCRLKNINPAKQRLSMVCSGISQASDFARIDNNAFRLLKSNLPGPFTFILPASPKLAKAFKGRHEVGVRIPDNPIATRIAEALGNPLLSASITSGKSDRSDMSDESDRSDRSDGSDFLLHPEEIMLNYDSSADAMIDGGTAVGAPTAVVSLIDSSTPELLREGPLPLAD